MTPMFQRLPLELVDAILEHLTDDKSALAACCRVCKALVHPSRRLLFDAVEINELSATRLLALMPSISSTKTSPVLPYIRHLRLFGYLRQSLLNGAVSCLPLLKNLRSLAFTRLPTSWSMITPAASPEASFSNCNNVVRLHLSRVYFTTFADLARIVCAFRHLNNLILTHIQCAKPHLPSPPLSPSQTLRALEIWNSDWVSILGWLLSLNHVPALQTLCVRGSRRGGSLASSLGNFLNALGPHLENLWLGPGIVEDADITFDLTHNPCLRSLTIQLWRVPHDRRHLSNLLSEAVSCKMEEIIVGLLYMYDGMDSVDWEHLDAILARPQFSKLRTLRICTNSDHSAWLFNDLSQTSSRGILSIDHSFRRKLAVL